MIMHHANVYARDRAVIGASALFDLEKWLSVVWLFKAKLKILLKLRRTSENLELLRKI